MFSEKERKAAAQADEEASRLDISAWIRHRLGNYSEEELAGYIGDESLCSPMKGKDDVAFWLSPVEAQKPCEYFNITLANIPDTRPWMAFTPSGGGETPSMVEQMAFSRRWHGEYGATPAVVAGGSWSLSVERPPQTFDAAEALAWQHCAFCPDCVDEMGLEPATIRALAEQLLGATVWHFWWD